MERDLLAKYSEVADDDDSPVMPTNAKRSGRVVDNSDSDDDSNDDEDEIIRGNSRTCHVIVLTRN